jgi:hypothetical protein
VITGPTFFYGDSKVFGEDGENRLAFPLYSRTNEKIDLSEAQEQAILIAVKGIVRNGVIELRKSLGGNICTVLVSLNDYNKEHSETIKSTIQEALALI